ncbi:MAG: type III-A CRISPR-associated protein Csm2 [Syntrophorhabdaceae bacterium]|nr:type III-A CRISPR-associated protein Csm2 [Syntrophorhabdaceae bacterium]
MSNGKFQKHGFSKGEESKGFSVTSIKQKLEAFKTKGLSEISADELVLIAQEMGNHLKNIGLKTTQIRRFLDGVRKLDVHFNKGKDFNPDNIILLKPKLAYAAGRNPNEVKPLMDVLEPAITAGSKSYKDFKKLLYLIESIVAYHKFFGGSD